MNPSVPVAPRQRIPKFAPKSMFYGWVVVGVAVIAVLMTAGSRAAPGALLVDMERSTGWSTSTLSIAASISLVMYGVGGPLAAFVMSRIGLRSTTVMSLLLAAVSFLFSAAFSSLAPERWVRSYACTRSAPGVTAHARESDAWLHELPRSGGALSGRPLGLPILATAGPWPRSSRAGRGPPQSS